MNNFAPSTARPPIHSLALERLKSLPSRPAVWQLGLVRMPRWVAEEGTAPYRPLVSICRSAAGGPVGAGQACAPGDDVGPAAIEAVAKLAMVPGVGYRPHSIEVCDAHVADAVRAPLAGCGIELLLIEQLEQIDEVSADMARQLGGKATSLRFFEPGLDVRAVRAFAQAAVEFHRAALWNWLSDEDLICVDSPAAPKGMACFNVLGAGGIEYGLGFFPSLKAHTRFAGSDPLDVQIAAGGLWLMSYAEIMDLPLADSELWEAHDLPTAGAAGYPTLVCHLPNRSATPADAERLVFAEALLRALNATTEDDIDTGRWSKTVDTFGGPRTIALSLPSILEDSPRARAKQPAAPRTKQGKAQALIDRAFEVSGRLRIKLAREALLLWPDCAEGYLLQAEAMPDLTRRGELYRLALKAAERVLGPKPFTEYVGYFWGVLETRPYMRARYGLANALWDTGQHDEAIAHGFDMLRLCPGDNMGVRGVLVPRLLHVGRDADAERVLAQFDDDVSAVLGYSRALLEFRRSGAGPAAQRRLDVAVQRNAHVPKYLTARVSMAGPLPGSYQLGSDDEARIATAEMLMPWRSTAGAIAWLSRSLPPARPPKSERREQRKAGSGKQRW